MKSIAPLAMIGLAALAAPTFAQQAPRAVATTEAAWTQKKIDLDIRDTSVLDAIKQILEKAGLTEYEIAPEVAEVAKDRKVTLVLSDIRANDALASVCRLAGGVAMSETRDGKTKINIVKRSSGQARVFTFGTPFPGRGGDAQLEARVKAALDQANRAVSSYTFAISPGYALDKSLADKRLSIDVRRKDVRDILKEMLNKVDVGIALEDDVPDTKHSFTFENVPLAVALDVVCRSVDIGWRAEKQAEKWVIRVGKKYARRRAFLRPSGRANAFFGDAGATPFSGMAPADWERFGIEMGQWGEGLAESILKEVTPGDAEENATSLVLEENPVP